MPRFVVSATLLALTAALISLRFAKSSGDRFWCFILTAVAELGLLASSLSLLGRSLAAGPWLVAQTILLVTVFYACHRSPPSITAGIRLPILRIVWRARALCRPSIPVAAFAFAFVAFTTVSACRQWHVPLNDLDDLNYEASRVMYCLQERSIFLPRTNNDRQTALTATAALPFLWARLCGPISDERLARMVHWLAYPLTALGTYTVVRAAGAPRSRALCCAALYAATPAAAHLAISLKGDPWQALFATALAYAIVRAGRCANQCHRSNHNRPLAAPRPHPLAVSHVSPPDLPRRPSPCAAPPDAALRPLALAGFALGFAIAAKSTFLALLPFAALIPTLLPRTSRPQLLHRYAAWSLAILAALLLSTAAATFTLNTVRFGHPLGSAAFRQTHAAEVSPHQLLTHLARIPITLIDLPEVPFAHVRASVTTAVHRALHATGADAPLPLEDNPNWPGPFTFDLPEYAQHFSLPGLLWLPTLAAALALLGAHALRALPHLGVALARRVPESNIDSHTPPCPAVPPAAALALLATPALLAPALFIRWMGGGPDRFWLAAYAMALPLIFILLSPLLRRPWTTAAAVLLVVYTIYPALHVQASYLDRDLTAHTPPLTSTPYGQVAAAIPAGSRVIVFGSFDDLDYPLFNPRKRTRNTVIPWGPRPFTRPALDQLIRDRRATHVFVSSDAYLAPGWWDTPLDPTAIIRDLSNDPAFTQIPLPDPHLHLFRTPAAPKVNAHKS